MSVVSYLFIAFLAITVFVYYIVPKKMQWVVLLAASLIFYGCSGIENLLIVTGTALLVYPLSLLMQKKSGQTGAAFGWSRETGSQKDKKSTKKEKKEIFDSCVIPCDWNSCCF